MIKVQLEQKLKEIDEIIKKDYLDLPNIGVLEGLSGVSLFQFYYSRYLNISDSQHIGLETLNLCIEKINNGNVQSTYCNGISGFGWVLDHLVQEKFINIDNDSYLIQFDEHLSSAMVNTLNEGNYEFLYGGVGIAYYFFNRFKNTKSKKLKNEYKKTLLYFISQLENIAKKEGDKKIMWLTLIDHENNESGCDLGISHGICGIIGILTKLYIYQDFKSSVKLILEKSINYVISNSEGDLHKFSYFPNSISEIRIKMGKSRLAWCYGDLGIGLMLFRASIALNDKNLKNTSLVILRHAAKRTTRKKSWVNDPFLCHGSYGIALIFDRIYKDTGEQIFNKSKEFWAELGLKMISNDQNVSFKDWDLVKNEWKSKISIIDGVAGIGLTIITFLSELDSNWDENLLIN